MVLKRRGLVTRVTPPISLTLATRSRDYVRGLDATRYVGSPASPPANEAMNHWIAFFAAAYTRAVADAESFERKVQRLQQDWQVRLGSIRSDSSVIALLQRLPEMPVPTANSAANALGRTFSAVNRVFEARELIDAFTALERQLASPLGDTRSSLPVRTVPRRPRRKV